VGAKTLKLVIRKVTELVEVEIGLKMQEAKVGALR
jgi:hypothetical protein